VETVAEGFAQPWGLDFLPGGEVVMTQAPGMLSVVDPESGEVTDIGGVPDVETAGQGGLLDVAVAPEFEDTGWVYLTYSAADSSGATSTHLARGTLDPDSRPGLEGANRKVKGTLHWVSAAHAVPVEVRNYQRLFTVENPDAAEEGKSFLDNLNPQSVELSTALVEPALAQAAIGDRMQFERLGYYCVDPDSRAGKPIFNRIVPLRDTWGKIEAKGGRGVDTT
jgi:hypothetical protein